jgi:ribosomal-protein-alanine N-acetyltransferase
MIGMSSTIKSDRLDLVTFSPSFLRASLDGDLNQAEAILELSLPAGWPVCDEPGWPDCRDVLGLRLQQLEEDPTFQPWLLRAMVPRGSCFMAGYIGFHSVPGAAYLQVYSRDAVELGFSVFPPYRRRGYAREACRALMGWAHECHGVTRFVMTIRPDNVASQSLAASLGFVRIGSHIDEVDGLEEILECDVSGDDIH